MKITKNNTEYLVTSYYVLWTSGDKEFKLRLSDYVAPFEEQQKEMVESISADKDYWENWLTTFSGNIADKVCLIIEDGEDYNSVCYNTTYHVRTEFTYLALKFFMAGKTSLDDFAKFMVASYEQYSAEEALNNKFLGLNFEAIKYKQEQYFILSGNQTFYNFVFIVIDGDGEILEPNSDAFKGVLNKYLLFAGMD